MSESVGYGTGDVAAFSISGSSYGCGPGDAALQLHKDVCLMTINLDILDQYVLCLQGTASKILELGLRSPPLVCINGGHRTVTALAGSGTHPLRTL